MSWWHCRGSLCFRLCNLSCNPSVFPLSLWRGMLAPEFAPWFRIVEGFRHLGILHEGECRGIRSLQTLLLDNCTAECVPSQQYTFCRQHLQLMRCRAIDPPPLLTLRPTYCNSDAMAETVDADILARLAPRIAADRLSHPERYPERVCTLVFCADGSFLNAKQTQDMNFVFRLKAQQDVLDMHDYRRHGRADWGSFYRMILHLTAVKHIVDVPDVVLLGAYIFTCDGCKTTMVVSTHPPGTSMEQMDAFQYYSGLNRGDVAADDSALLQQQQAVCWNPRCPLASIFVWTKSCSRCRNARYCTRECQRQHWPQHRQSCGAEK